MKSKGKIIGIIIMLILIVVFLIGGFVLYKNSDAVRVKKQLDLGEKYLAELDYDQAIVAYEKVIEIEPMNVEAYLGLADAYIGKDDYESALVVLQKGYDLTGNEEIGNKLDEIKEEIERRKYAEELKMALAKETEEEAEEKGDMYIDFDFELTDFGIAGYDLFDRNCDEICAELGINLPSTILGETMNGIEAYYTDYDNSFCLDYFVDDCIVVSFSDASDIEFNKRDIRVLGVFCPEGKDINEIEIPSYFNIPNIFGRSYEAWCEEFKIEEIKEKNLRTDNTIGGYHHSYSADGEDEYYFLTRWGDEDVFSDYYESEAEDGKHRCRLDFVLTKKTTYTIEIEIGNENVIDNILLRYVAQF